MNRMCVSVMLMVLLILIICNTSSQIGSVKVEAKSACINVEIDDQLPKFSVSHDYPICKYADVCLKVEFSNFIDHAILFRRKLNIHSDQIYRGYLEGYI